MNVKQGLGSECISSASTRGMCGEARQQTIAAQSLSINIRLFGKGRPHFSFQPGTRPSFTNLVRRREKLTTDPPVKSTAKAPQVKSSQILVWVAIVRRLVHSVLDPLCTPTPSTGSHGTPLLLSVSLPVSFISLKAQFMSMVLNTHSVNLFSLAEAF